MSIEDLNLNEIEGVEAEIRARRDEDNRKKTEQHHGSRETKTTAELDFDARERAARMEGYNSRDIEQHYGSRESKTTEELDFDARERAARMAEYNDRDIEQHYGSRESKTTAELDFDAREKAARMEEYNDRDIEQHYGSRESKTTEELDFDARERAARMEGYNSRETEQHYGSIENADDATVGVMEALRKEQKEKAIPYTEYFNNLINNLTIEDQTQFERAVSESMQSNEIMRKFVDGICGRIEEKTFELRNTDKDDKEKIASVKQEIEKMVALYERYMYTLKANEWDFSDIHRLQMSEDVTSSLWDQQKRLDIVFTMPIPADMGEYYGGKFEREGRMIPGITFMYDDLSGKQVNWHQVMIYRENELTPGQRYKQKLIGEITKKQEELGNKKQELADLNQQIQQGGNVYGE